MNDDRLLQDLARLAKDDREAEARRLDERWDRLSAGGLPADEEAKLRALAESSDEIRDAYDAFRPLDADFRERVLHAVLAPETETVEQAPGKVLPFRRRALRAGGWLAAAAVLALSALRLGDSGDPLPEYRLELEGGVRQIRSEDAGAADRVFAPGSRMELVLRPRVAVTGPVEASFFVARGDELRSWEVAAEISPTGAVRIAGVLGRDFELEPGEWTLWAAVGRTGTLPEPDELRDLLGDLDPPVADDWILLRTRLRVEP